MYQRSVVKVNVDQIVRNYKIHLQFLTREQAPVAVVKANAYGHGAIPVSCALYEAGCRHFAVADLAEAVELREQALLPDDATIFILGYVAPEYIPSLISHHLCPVLVDEAHAEKCLNALQASGLNPKDFHAEFALDSGMNRIGLDIKSETAQAAAIAVIRKYASLISLDGLFTHLCKADNFSQEDLAFTDLQQNRFMAVCEEVTDLNLPFIHCQNSAGTIWHRPYGNLVRLGITLYGLKPDYSNILPVGLAPAMSWSSMVTHVHTVFPGESIGYGHGFSLPADASPLKVATISIGYADGYHRTLSNHGKIFINGQSAPILGRVCMDQLMVDISHITTPVQAGTEAELLGPHYTADDMAQDADTIGYEIVCNIAPRAKENYEITHDSL